MPLSWNSCVSPSMSSGPTPLTNFFVNFNLVEKYSGKPNLTCFGRGVTGVCLPSEPVGCCIADLVSCMSSTSIVEGFLLCSCLSSLAILSSSSLRVCGFLSAGEIDVSSTGRNLF